MLEVPLVRLDPDLPVPSYAHQGDAGADLAEVLGLLEVGGEAAADLVDARVAGTTATVAVKFAAKLASATLDRSGAVIDGSTTAVVDHLDVWTFTRQLGSRDPNWQLSATETAMGAGPMIE